MEITVHLDRVDKAISPELFGIFFEDLNHAADGGLYGELIRNRSFDFSALEQPDWNALSFWELVREGGAEGSLVVDAARPLHPRNKQYAVLDIRNDKGTLALRNHGFDGISVRAGKEYEFSVFARLLYKGSRWTPDTPADPAVALSARLVNPTGKVIAEAELPPAIKEWSMLEVILRPDADEPDATFELVARNAGGIALDMISLFPRDTFRNRPNGLRRDLAEAIAALKPAFMRFPGGCLVHGNGIGNFYDWKDTVGPVASRPGQPNLWGYHQSNGLGYFEYFQFCEDIGAIPVPVVPAAVSCQNSGHTFGEGQECLPMEEMEAYIQDLLDLIEWANGPADSQWGSVRAASGHPESFGIKYLGVGNEDKITPGFKTRFRMIYDALQKAHPEIVVIGTVGPFPDGEDFEKGWRIARELDLEMVDEHFYRDPQWFLENLGRYDSYDRSGPAVYLGEYAAHDDHRRRTLRAALAEAAFMTALERNGDIVRMASYAPLLGKIGRTQWNPDLVYFDNESVYPTISYTVQQLFAESRGDQLLAATTDIRGAGPMFSVVRDSRSGNRFIKLVNPASEPVVLNLILDSNAALPDSATITTLAGDPDAVNEPGRDASVQPVDESVPLDGPTVKRQLPPHSLVIIALRGER